MSRPEHWEPPDPPKLLVSARRVAEELDIPIWKANELCWCLDRRFYAPGGMHYRVTRTSLDAFKDLLDQGLSYNHAKTVMWNYRQREEQPPTPISQEVVNRIYWQSRRRRRRWY